MANPPALPIRKNKVFSAVQKDYSYKYILENNINIENIESILISKEDLSLNFDLFKKLINQKNQIKIKFYDYECVKYVDKILTEPINNECILVHDGLLINRDYIDLTKLNNIDLTIPLNYLMWGIKFNDIVKVYGFKFYNDKLDFNNYVSINGNKEVSFENYRIILDKINELSRYNIKEAKELVMFISDYIQSRTQYIDSKESEGSKGIYVTPEFPEYNDYRLKSGLVETVLNNQNGLCMGISNLSTLLLNNGEFKLPVETNYGSNHAWNSIIIDGKRYYFDNTWSITRSKYIHDDALMTTKFNDGYLLFGSKVSEKIGHHTLESVHFYEAKDDENNLELPDYESKFIYQKKPVYRSYKK